MAKDDVKRALEEAVKTEEARRREQASPLGKLARFVVTEEQVRDMAETTMIWRQLIARSHLAVWAAPGNGGKTTIAKLAAAELSAAGYDVLFFQEDAAAGDLPALHAHAVEHGYRMLNSTLANSAIEDQIAVLADLVDSGADLSNVVLFFDTLKKFVEVLNKGGARAFFKLMRGLTIRGATIVLLGHTNKHRGPDGKLIFEGVGDVRNDVDELLYIESIKDRDSVTMTVQPDKVRAIVREATFRLDLVTMAVHALPHVVDVAERLRMAKHRREDADLIEHIRAALKQAGGGMTKTALIEQVAATSGVGQKTVRGVVNRYLGNDPADTGALWIETYVRATNTRRVSLAPAQAAPCQATKLAKLAKPTAG